MNRVRIPVLLLLLLCAIDVSAQTTRQEPYRWKSVQIVGGGFVDGVIFHPTASDVRYARTDMGGAYRFDATTHRWQPILDWVPYKDLNLMGVESIAVDPADSNRVYLACGTYTNPTTPNGAILSSQDRGRTFKRVDVPFKFGGNEDGRGNGERLAVDPHDGSVVYLGTRHDGLWRSSDHGATWMRVASFPDVTEPIPPQPVPVPGETEDQHWQRIPARSSGIVFVKFAATPDPQNVNAFKQTIYVGVSLKNRANLFASNDGGASWHEVAGAPTGYRPTRAALSSDGFLYIAYGTAPGPTRMTNGAVWKLNTRTGAWTDITPDPPIAGSKEFGYAAVSVDARNPQTLIASSFGRPRSAGDEDIFRSTDGGAHWKPIFGDGGVYDYSGAPYVKSTPIHWLFDIEIDPTNSDHAVFTTGYGGWETFDLTAADQGKPTHWSILAGGIEETVALELVSPPQGAHLISGIGDYGGFVHADLDRPAPEGASAPPRMGNTDGVAFAALLPDTIVRVGNSAEHKQGQNIGYSLDGGHTWNPTPSAPTTRSRGGSIAVAADASAWVWTPQREPTAVSHDLGVSWKVSQGLPLGLRVIADPVAPKTFYSISLADRTLYRSDDDGDSFTGQHFTLPDNLPAVTTGRGDNRGGQDRIYATPGRSGDVWLAAWDGLFHAALGMPQNAGDLAFARLDGVEEIHAFGFGKGAPGHADPAIYLVGTIKGQPGIFRSIDRARTWVRINDDQHQWGLVLQVAGDPRIFGRVYVGMHGRGIFYGDPAH
jgi:hypothetical protein